MKKLAVLFLAIIISLCAVSSAVAANWVEVHRDKDVLMYFDSSSLQYNGNTIRVWEKWIYRSNNNVMNELSNYYKKRIYYVLYYHEYNVLKNTVSYLSSSYYSKNNTIIDSADNTATNIFITPDTITEVAFNFYKKILGIR